MSQYLEYFKRKNSIQFLVTLLPFNPIWSSLMLFSVPSSPIHSPPNCFSEHSQRLLFSHPHLHHHRPPYLAQADSTVWLTLDSRQAPSLPEFLHNFTGNDSLPELQVWNDKGNIWTGMLNCRHAEKAQTTVIWIHAAEGFFGGWGQLYS